MPQIRYVGPFDGVRLPSLNLTVAQGGVVEVDDEAFANLCEQHDWQPADGTPAPTTPPVADENGDQA